MLQFLVLNMDNTLKIVFGNTRLAMIVLVCFIIAINMNIISGSERGRCPNNLTLTIETECTSCHINVFVDCPKTTEKSTKMEGTPGCTYQMNLGPGPNITKDGCSHTCRGTVQVDQCCKGFWGPECDECPGGYMAPCYGHGDCLDLINGTGICVCDAGWTGYACEFCTDSSDANCTLTPGDGLCRNITCPNNSNCVVVDQEAVCMCNWPYVEHDNSTTDKYSILCKELDTCTLPPLCHANASCSKSSAPDITGLDKNCTCNNGFHGDGYKCDPVDLCQVNNGDCDLDTSDCVFLEIGKSKCACKDGYNSDALDTGCSLIDICTVNQSVCHPNAACQTVGPNQVRCTCSEGYAGDGNVCFGNILQVIKDLDDSDPDLKGQLTLIQGAISKYYMTELTQHATFTMFVPTNEGFRTIYAADYQQWLNDKVRVRQILRQHIVVGELTTDRLVNHSVFHTLLGTQAELMINRKSDILRFRILGSSKKARIVRGNITASNGIIHIINKLMTNAPYNFGNEQKTIYENIKLAGKYNRFQTLVDAVGPEIQDIVTSQNVTLFVPNNAAFDSLPIGAIDFLTSSEGKGHLVALLKNHIFEDIMEVTDLINKRRITSIAKISSWVTVEETGYVQLGDGVNITLTDIPASNGLMHDLDGVLVADDISILPNNCDLYTYSDVMGPCGDCREKGRCFPPDKELEDIAPCQYYAKDSAGKYQKLSGCALMCNRTYTSPKCCDGFYGFDCLPCPGGHKNPCNGNGKCDDGYFKDGTCTCDHYFGGPACDRCADSKHFGPDCTQECTCVHGVCTAGPQGDGKCHLSLCNSGYRGENCDVRTNICNDQQHYCHAYALCIWREEKLDFGCICQPGYSGNGLHCKEIDPCTQPRRGGCHIQATCLKTSPGIANCTCNEGWTGDGAHCHLETTCSNHSECHKYATCIPTSPGKHICQCKEDFEGNGTFCLYKNRCEVNNGGCYPLAKCRHDNRSEISVNCTCPVDHGYSGNGFSCYGNLLMEIENHPKLMTTAALLRQMSSSERQLLLDNNYTIFMGTDEAMFNFSTSGGHKSTHWMKPENLITLLNYHTLLGSYSLDKLVAISEIKKLDTMADGFSVYITKGKDEIVRLMPQRTGTVAKVIESDIIATNGYLNIIDKIMEPYEPMSPENYSDLETFFSNHSEYSIFAGWLKGRNLTYKLENVMDAYTLFVPNNEETKYINRTVTTDYLRYYMLPRQRMIASSDNGDVRVTDLGRNHQLIIHSQHWNKYTVNGVAIVKADMFTYGGLVNEIGGLLHPMLHECDEKDSTVDFGPCTTCSGTVSPCHGNSTPVPYREPLQCLYTEKDVFGNLKKRNGCQGLCVTQTLIKGCCAGYFGEKCKECPSGPEFSCSGHGTCDDGIHGNGTCQCDPKFEGELCGVCIEGWAGINCDIDKNGCGYKNGGCHKHADCNRGNGGQISCKCWDGFQGDGYNCSGACDVANGGCHSNATCLYIKKYEVRCQCKEGLVGDGRAYCMGDIMASLDLVPKTTWFLKSLQKLSDKMLLDHLTSLTSTDKFILFVPVDKSLKYRTLPELSILQQIVVVSRQTYGQTILDPVDFSNITLTTLSNQTVTVTYNQAENRFYVNGTRMLAGNIKFTNGVVHIVVQPFSQPPSLESPTPGSLPIGAILGPLAALVLIVAVVGVGVVVYRRSHTGYWNLLQTWVAKRRDSDTSQQAPLHVDDHSEGACASGLPLRDSSFGNPLYKTEDLE